MMNLFPQVVEVLKYVEQDGSTLCNIIKLSVFCHISRRLILCFFILDVENSRPHECLPYQNIFKKKSKYF